jgi:hypothetical protein
MKRISTLLAAVAFVGSVPPCMAGAAPSAKAEIASRQFLIGTWNCAFTVGAQSGRYTTVWSNALGGTWLAQRIDQVGAGGVGSFQAEYLIGYDEAHQGWVRFGAMTTGQYFAIRMKDTGDEGWSWKYVSFFPRRTPETTQSDATFARRSDGEYLIDGPTYPNGNGVQVTEHHVCRKVT